jgi:hypothetical protein
MRLVLVPILAALLGGTSAAEASPPPNDAPWAAAEFSAYGAANGRPRDLQALAELAEATADPGVPRCLGAGAFARTAWFRVPAAASAQEIAIDAVGRTLDLVDLAAFVQPVGAGAIATSSPNACAGEGTGGAAVAEEAASGLVLRVAAGRAVLIQAGRRGVPGPPEDERALLSLDTRELARDPAPSGDAAGAATPIVPSRRTATVPLAGATLGGEDPAQPACPSPASVWRRFVPGGPGTRLISVTGRAASTLTVYAGARPTPDNARDCVLRSRYGALQLRVATERRRPLWIRIGTAKPAAGDAARVRVTDGTGATVVDGGPGGFDPTPGGAGGGLPAACERARATRARVTGPRLSRAAARGRSVRMVIRMRRSALCDVTLKLVGPGGGAFATARAVRLAGRRVVRLRRERRLVRGRYRLRVEAASELGGRVEVPSSVRGRLR